MPEPTSTTTPPRLPTRRSSRPWRARSPRISATRRASITSASAPRRCWTRRGRRSRQLIGAEPAEIVFTSGGTEADNLALRGAAEALEATAARRHIITSSIEHEAVLNTVKALVQARLDVDAPAGRLDRHRRAGVARRRDHARDGDRLGDARQQRDRHDPADRGSRGDRARARRALSHRRRAVGRARSRWTCARSASICCRCPRTSSTGPRGPARCGFAAARGSCRR